PRTLNPTPGSSLRDLLHVDRVLLRTVLRRALAARARRGIHRAVSRVLLGLRPAARFVRGGGVNHRDTETRRRRASHVGRLCRPITPFAKTGGNTTNRYAGRCVSTGLHERCRRVAAACDARRRSAASAPSAVALLRVSVSLWFTASRAAA